MQSQKAFTLIELITVIVLTGIIGAIGLGFFVSLTKSYNVSQDRASVAANGLIVLEQLAREFRLALPFSLRVSSSGNCIEYFSIVGGASYEGAVPTPDNGAVAISSLSVSPIYTQLDAARYAYIGGLSAGAIYSSATARPRVLLSITPSANATSLTFSSGHIFAQNSISKRVFLTGNPVRVCYVTSSQRLEKYINPSVIPTAVSDSQPSGSTRILMGEDISAVTAFSVSAGNDQENITVTIALTFIAKNQSVSLTKAIQVRNSP